MSSTTAQGNHVSVQVDMDIDTGILAQQIENLQNTYGVTIKILKTHGPASGIPFVELSGHRGQVVAALLGWWQLDQEDLDELVGDDLDRDNEDEGAPEFFDASRRLKKPMDLSKSWNHFEHFELVTTTTAKLADELEDIQLHNTMVRNGGDSTGDYPNDYHYVMKVEYQGGRDWVIVIGIDPAEAA